METDTTREGIGDFIPCIDPQCDKNGTTVIVNSAGEPEPMQCEYCHRERFPIIEYHHHQLQKAREEALAREKQLKQVHMMELDAISCKSIEDFVIWRDHRKQRPKTTPLTN